MRLLPKLSPRSLLSRQILSLRVEWATDLKSPSPSPSKTRPRDPLLPPSTHETSPISVQSCCLPSRWIPRLPGGTRLRRGGCSQRCLPIRGERERRSRDQSSTRIQRETSSSPSLVEELSPRSSFTTARSSQCPRRLLSSFLNDPMVPSPPLPTDPPTSTTSLSRFESSPTPKRTISTPSPTPLFLLHLSSSRPSPFDQLFVTVTACRLSPTGGRTIAWPLSTRRRSPPQDGRRLLSPLNPSPIRR